MNVQQTFEAIATIANGKYSFTKCKTENTWEQIPGMRNAEAFRSIAVSMIGKNRIKYEEVTKIKSHYYYEHVDVKNKTIVLTFIENTERVQATANFEQMPPIYTNGISEDDLKTIFGNTALFGK